MSIISPEQIDAAVRGKGYNYGWRIDGIESRARFLKGLVVLEIEHEHGAITRTQQQIANALGLKRRTVEVLLRSLADAGALEYQPSPGGTPATYSLQTDWFDSLPMTTTQAEVPAAPARHINRQTAKTASRRRPPSRRATEQPWQQAVDAVRTELGGQLEALARQVQILTSRLAAVGGEPQIESDEQQREREGQGKTDPAPATTTTPPGSLDAQALLFQMDARLQTFADTLATRLEHVLGGGLRRSPEPDTDDNTKQSNAAGVAADSDGQNQEQAREQAAGAAAEAEVEAEIEEVEAQTEDTQEPVAIEDEQDEQTPLAGNAEHTKAEQTDNEQAEAQWPVADHPEALQTDQAGQITPAKRRPGRPLKDPATLNRLEARADILFEQLTAILELPGEAQATALIELARAELDWQAHHYQGDDGQPVWNTILKTNMRITKRRLIDQAIAQALSDIPIDQLEDHTDDAPIVKLVKLWGSTFDTAVEAQTERLNKAYREQARAQALDPTPVDLSDWLRLARNTLEGVAHGKEVQWEAVSFALALATGRRQAEVHCTGALLPVDDTSDLNHDVAALKDGYAVVFAGRRDRLFGQTKVRTGTEAEKEWRARPLRLIPTLLPAELVLAGWQWLEEQGHKVEHEDEVNGAFNGKLRSFMQKTATGFSYKNLRDFYAVGCWRNWLRDGVAETSLPERLKEVLGHGPLGDATPSYRKFCLMEGSESRL